MNERRGEDKIGEDRKGKERRGKDRRGESWMDDKSRGLVGECVENHKR